MECDGTEPALVLGYHWVTVGHDGLWFSLHLLEDVFRRKIVGYEIPAVESNEHAAELVYRTVLSEHCCMRIMALQ